MPRTHHESRRPMLDRVIQILEQCDFIAVKSAFDHMLLDDECRAAVAQQRQTSQAAALLASYPDVFAYPRKGAPEGTCFFAVVANDDGSLEPDRQRALTAHFPIDR